MDTYDRPAAPDLRNEGIPWTHLVRWVPAGASALDVGCWDGMLLGLLRERGTGRLRGVERDPEAVARARARGLDVVPADLDDPAWPSALGGERFDRVILADVVEHVRDPAALLRIVVDRVLAPGGRVLFSVPNVAHASVRLSLLLGDFDRTDLGLLDRTHLHFFTRRSLHALLRDAGLASRDAVDLMKDVPVDVARAMLSRAGVASAPDLERLLCEGPDARTYQFVGSAEPVPPGTPIPPPPPPTAGDVPRVVDRLLRAQVARIHRLEERVRALESRGPLRALRAGWRRLRRGRAGRPTEPEG